MDLFEYQDVPNISLNSVMLERLDVVSQPELLQAPQSVRVIEIEAKETQFSIRGFIFYLAMVMVIIMMTYIRDWIVDNLRAETFRILIACLK